MCESTGLKFLVRLCTDLGMKEAQEYATKLKKAEKAKELRDQVGSILLNLTVLVAFKLSFFVMVHLRNFINRHNIV